jgi:hypothetical protein
MDWLTLAYGLAGRTLYASLTTPYGLAWDGVRLSNNPAATIPLAERSPGIYGTPAPSLLPPGEYLVAVRLQLGGWPIPASDPLVGAGARVWDGGTPTAPPPVGSTPHGTEFRFWPFREDATLSVPQNPSLRQLHPLHYPGGAVKRRAVTRAELIASGGVVRSDDLVWLLPTAVLPAGVEPSPGDRVVELSGREWTILSVVAGKYGQTYRCTTRCLSLSYQLRDLATVERPTVTPGGGGVASRTFEPFAVNVACRLQPESREVESEVAGRVVTRERYTAYLAEPLLLQAGDQLRVSARRYSVIRQSEIATLDRLCAVACEALS